MAFIVRLMMPRELDGRELWHEFEESLASISIKTALKYLDASVHRSTQKVDRLHTGHTISGLLLLLSNTTCQY